jgi:hypothetical protein
VCFKNSLIKCITQLRADLPLLESGEILWESGQIVFYAHLRGRIPRTDDSTYQQAIRKHAYRHCFQKFRFWGWASRTIFMVNTRTRTHATTLTDATHTRTDTQLADECVELSGDPFPESLPDWLKAWHCRNDKQPLGQSDGKKRKFSDDSDDDADVST